MSNVNCFILAVSVAASFSLASSSHVAAQVAQIRTQLPGNKCMVVKSASHVPQTPLFLYDCNRTENEWFLPVVTGEFKLYNGSQCLGVAGGVGNKGDAIVLADCNSTASQHWVWDNGAIRGINGRCIDVAGGLTANETPILLWDCHGGVGQRWITTQAAATAMGPRRKLYSLDGTDSKEIHHNALFHVYERFDGQKYWINGPTLFATNINEIYSAASTEMCADLRAGRVNDVFITGYSRGSIIAIKLANNAIGCGGNVRFVGLIDAVNTSMTTNFWPVTVRSGIPLVVHIRKTNGYETVLTTADIYGAMHVMNIIPSATHKQMTCYEAGSDDAWRWTRNQMITYAQQVGAVFTPQVRAGTNC